MHSGLSDLEASRRLAQDGPNELPVSRPRGVLRLLRDVVSEPMFLCWWPAAPSTWYWATAMRP